MVARVYLPPRLHVALFVYSVDLLDDTGEYGSAFRLWANSETKLADTLNGLSRSLDKNIESLRDLVY